MFIGVVEEENVALIIPGGCVVNSCTVLIGAPTQFQDRVYHKQQSIDFIMDNHKDLRDNVSDLQHPPQDDCESELENLIMSFEDVFDASDLEATAYDPLLNENIDETLLEDYFKSHQLPETENFFQSNVNWGSSNLWLDSMWAVGNEALSSSSSNQQTIPDQRKNDNSGSNFLNTLMQTSTEHKAELPSNTMSIDELESSILQSDYVNLFGDKTPKKLKNDALKGKSIQSDTPDWYVVKDLKITEVSEDERAPQPEFLPTDFKRYKLKTEDLQHEVELFGKYLQKLTNTMLVIHSKYKMHDEECKKIRQKIEGVKSQPVGHRDIALHRLKQAYMHNSEICRLNFRYFQQLERIQNISRKHFYEYIAACLDEPSRLQLFTLREAGLKQTVDTMSAKLRQLFVDMRKTSRQYQEARDNDSAGTSSDLTTVLKCLLAPKKLLTCVKKCVHVQFNLLQRQYLELKSEFDFFKSLREPVLTEKRFLRQYLFMHKKWHQQTTAQEKPKVSRQQLYSNLLRPSERTWLYNIQNRQNEQANPYLDDFYYHRFTQNLAAKGASDITYVPTVLPPESKAVEHKEYVPSFDTSRALGSLRSASAFAPRATITMERQALQDSYTDGPLAIPSKRTALIVIEKAFDFLLTIEDEDLRLNQTSDRKQKFIHETRRRESLANAMRALCVEHSNPTKTLSDEERHRRAHRELVFLRVLCEDKGKQLLSRIMLKSDKKSLLNIYQSLIRILPLIASNLNGLEFTLDQVERLKLHLLPTALQLLPMIESSSLLLLLSTFSDIMHESAPVAYNFFTEAGLSILWTLFHIIFSRCRDTNAYSFWQGHVLPIVQPLSEAIEKKVPSMNEREYSLTESMITCPAVKPKPSAAVGAVVDGSCWLLVVDGGRREQRQVVADSKATRKQIVQPEESMQNSAEATDA
eukprot:gene377-3726_t